MKKLLTFLFVLVNSFIVMSQTYTMQNGTFNTCGGTFYDSGGAGGFYGNNENYTITLCPTVAGDVIQLDFSSFDLDTISSADIMTIYNGSSTSDPAIGAYTSNPGIVQANNLTGCLTISFTSDIIFSGAGWQAAISCITPCQTITVQLDSVSITPSADNVIELCEGDSVSVTGSGVFSGNGAGATYEWNFGDGSPPVSSTTASHTFTTAGVYIINLYITDASSEVCTNSNYINLIAHVYGEPTFSNLATTSVCLGSNTTINVSATGQTVSANCDPPVVGTTFLPDGDGAVYSTCINVSCFDPGAVVTSTSDIIDICLNMEHSYFGDLDIIIIAPDGQQAMLVNDDLTSSSSIYLGEPFDHNDTATDVALGPGTGYDYCFSMTGSVNLDDGPKVNSGDSFAPGTYLPDESLTSLIGSPLNGQWCIEVVDNLIFDNGYIFNWDINFDTSFASPNLSYTQTIASESWQADPTIVSSSGGSLTINPNALGNICYTYEVVDNAGCTYTKNYCVDAITCTSTIDFDGVDDYINTAAFIGGNTQMSMMSWIKLDANFDGGEIMGQRNFRLFLDSNKRLKAYVRTDTGTTNNLTTPNTDAPVLTTDLWYHVAAIYDGAAKTLSLYLNGEQIWSGIGLTGNTIINSASWNSDHDFEIGRNTFNDNAYFEGSIYEARAYNVSLTNAQLQEQVHQGIENNGGNVRGSVIPKDIQGLSWDNLVLYYKMAVALPGSTPDTSIMVRHGSLNNMLTIQDQTAPIPYVADLSGTWNTPAIWLYQDVWDIPNKDWAIVQVTNNAKVTTTNSHTILGLLVDAGSELEIQNDQLLKATSYLRLDGQIDLVGESQLIQTLNSDLDVASSGYLERDQQGKADVFSYNYWSSPVNPINNYTNNKDYTLSEILKDGTDANNPLAITFNSSTYNGAATTPITIADYWVFKYANHPEDYDNWILGHVKSTGNIAVGEGYTQKGSGAGSATQNYVFVGKPNNGLIQLPINADYISLVGNPYPSAIDANQFILDNISSIEDSGDVIGSGTSTGALYFWEHWGGGSHLLADYQGGYATYNLVGATLAIPDPDVSGVGSGSVLPQRYIPVGQGFFVQGGAIGGTIEFNNGQRAFEKESDGSSTFISRGFSSPRAQAVSDDIKRFYFRFITPEGPQRQLLLATKEGLTEGIDYGYDAKLIEKQLSDCSWRVEGENLVIQSIGEIYDELELALNITIGADGVCKIKAEDISALPNGTAVYFVDKLLDQKVKLESELEHSFMLEEGEYVDRFYLVFNIEERQDYLEIIENIVVYHISSLNTIVIESQELFSASDIILYNILGQKVFSYKKQFNNVTKVSLPTNVKPGIYLVKFTHNNSKNISTKLLIK